MEKIRNFLEKIFFWNRELTREEERELLEKIFQKIKES